MIRNLVLILFMLLGAQSAQGRTWFVEKDGSGDYLVIQDALDAAADGDTIRIGAGRFEERRMYSLPGGSPYVFAFIENADLTIIGDGIGNTIIGPPQEWWDFDNFSMGILQMAAAGGVLTVEDLQIENVLQGSYIATNERFSFDSIKISHCRSGMIMFGTGDISGCSIVDIGALCIETHAPAENISVVDCYVTGRQGLSLQSTDNITVRNCQFNCESGGLAEFCSGGIYDSEFHNTLVGFSFFGPFPFTIRGNSFSGDWLGLYLSDHPENVIVEDNVIRGGTHFALEIDQAQPVVRNNDIIRGSGYSVILDNYRQTEFLNIDLTNNFWGTTDPEEIAAGIYDGHSDSGIRAYVVFDPILGGSVPTEAISLDGLKALYR